MNDYLKKRRLELSLTQKQVADFVGVSEATVSRWESGDIANMRRDRISMLAEVLRTSPTFIMTGKDEPTPKGDELVSVSDEDLRHLAAFHAADEDTKAVIVRLLKEFEAERGHPGE